MHLILIVASLICLIPETLTLTAHSISWSYPHIYPWLPVDPEDWIPVNLPNVLRKLATILTINPSSRVQIICVANLLSALPTALPAGPAITVEEVLEMFDLSSAGIAGKLFVVFVLWLVFAEKLGYTVNQKQEIETEEQAEQQQQLAIPLKSLPRPQRPRIVPSASMPTLESMQAQTLRVSQDPAMWQTEALKWERAGGDVYAALRSRQESRSRRDSLMSNASSSHGSHSHASHSHTSHPRPVIHNGIRSRSSSSVSSGSGSDSNTSPQPSRHGRVLQRHSTVGSSKTRSGSGSGSAGSRASGLGIGLALTEMAGLTHRTRNRSSSGSGSDSGISAASSRLSGPGLGRTAVGSAASSSTSRGTSAFTGIGERERREGQQMYTLKV